MIIMRSKLLWVFMLVVLGVVGVLEARDRKRREDALCREVRKVRRKAQERSDVQAYQLSSALLEWEGYYCEVREY